jgi:hypothetical protein
VETVLAQLEMFQQNIFLLLGLLLCAGIGFVLLIALIILLKMGWWSRQRRVERKRYDKRIFRADGRRYPAAIEDICDQCGRGNKKIYLTPEGPKLCTPCYEAHWRKLAGWIDPPPDLKRPSRNANKNRMN